MCYLVLSGMSDGILCQVRIIPTTPAPRLGHVFVLRLEIRSYLCEGNQGSLPRRTLSVGFLSASPQGLASFRVAVACGVRERGGASQPGALSVKEFDSLRFPKPILLSAIREPG